MALQATPALLGQRFFTVEQVADILQVHPESVRRWIRNGRLPAAQLGGRRLGYRVDPTDLRQFLVTNRT